MDIFHNLANKSGDQEEQLIEHFKVFHKYWKEYQDTWEQDLWYKINYV
jgi:hypothetical protein